MSPAKGSDALGDGAKTVVIPEIRLALITVVIQGVTPLITHRFGPRALAALEARQQREARGPREARDPEAEFHDSLYVVDQDDGRYGFPGAGVKKALVSAGGRFADEQMTRLRGVVNVLVDLLEIRGAAPRMRSDPVRLSGGVTSLAYRPMFEPWEMDVPLAYNSAVIGEAQLLNLFQIAGFAVGLGDWRPERNGIFGQFTIKEARQG